MHLYVRVFRTVDGARIAEYLKRQARPGHEARL